MGFGGRVGLGVGAEVVPKVRVEVMDGSDCALTGDTAFSCEIGIDSQLH